VQKFVVVGAGSAGMGVVGMTALGMMKHVSRFPQSQGMDQEKSKSLASHRQANL